MTAEREPRTLLEQELWRRGLTAEAFSHYADTFARDHGIAATLSVRHVQRLMAGATGDREPGPVRPGTRRLLETLFARPIGELLAPPEPVPQAHDALAVTASELAARLDAAAAIDATTITLFQDKLDLTRRLDRQLGALGTLGELRELIRQLDDTRCYTTRPELRAALARILVDCTTLAGWQSLDRGQTTDAWRYYDHAKRAAREANSADLDAYAHAAQATVLLDLGRPAHAVALTAHARTLTAPTAPRLLRSWLAAAHGEAHAATGDRSAALRAFDDAARLMPEAGDPAATPYLVFGPVHLDRWRGGALAMLGDPEAVPVLSAALASLDPTFTRAETALRVDLASVLTATGDPDAAVDHSTRARQLAGAIGSQRQQRRLHALTPA